MMTNAAQTKKTDTEMRADEIQEAERWLKDQLLEMFMDFASDERNRERIQQCSVIAVALLANGWRA